MAPSTKSILGGRTGARTLATENSIIRGAVFASGNGSNAENIIRFAQNNPGEISIPLVICDQPEAGVIDRAKKLGVPCFVVPGTRATRDEQEKKILDILAAHGVTWVFLAGYMRILSASFLAHFPQRVVNIHPSLLPEFPGKDSYRRAYDAGVKASGVTLHFVDEGVDTGPVIAQRKFERVPGESFEDFRARGLALEYEVYTVFLKELCHGGRDQDRNRIQNSGQASGKMG